MTEPPDVWTAESVSICITVYHEHICAWAEQVGVRPSAPNENHREYPFVFTSGALDPGSADMTWSDFFLAFERANVALAYGTHTRTLEPDGSHQFVSRAAVPELVKSNTVKSAI